MAKISRRVRDAVNPMSTAFTRWWCHSALRHMLTGYGPTPRQRRLLRHGERGTIVTPSPEQMEARRRAIDNLLASDRNRNP